jgi:hypothetical protein
VEAAAHVQPARAPQTSGELRHITAEFRAFNREIFEHAVGSRTVPIRGPAGIRRRHPINLMGDFVPHGQMRGWVDDAMRHYMRGHHPEYNEWVRDHLLDVLTTPGLTRQEAFRRFVEAQRRLRWVIEDHADILNFAPFSVSLGSFL